jgi:hypothetical protein
MWLFPHMTKVTCLHSHNYMNLNVIKIDTVDSPGFYNRIVNMPRHVLIEEPILTYRVSPYKTTRNIIYYLGQEPIENMVHLDKVPEDTEIIKSMRTDGPSRVIFLSSDVASISIFIPDTMDYSSVVQNYRLAIVGVCRRYGVHAFVKGNDALFDDGTYEKKFFGVSDLRANNCTIVTGMMTFIADTEFMNNVLNFSHSSLAKKNITDTSTYIGGLEEVIPNMDREAFTAEIGVEFANLLGLNHNEVTVVTDQKTIVDKQGVPLANDNWIVRGIYPN